MKSSEIIDRLVVRTGCVNDRLPRLMAVWFENWNSKSAPVENSLPKPVAVLNTQLFCAPTSEPK